MDVREMGSSECKSVVDVANSDEQRAEGGHGGAVSRRMRCGSSTGSTDGTSRVRALSDKMS